jgi:hypothetical protein
MGRRSQLAEFAGEVAGVIVLTGIQCNAKVTGRDLCRVEGRLALGRARRLDQARVRRQAVPILLACRYP